MLAGHCGTSPERAASLVDAGAGARDAASAATDGGPADAASSDGGVNATDSSLPFLADATLATDSATDAPDAGSEDALDVETSAPVVTSVLQFHNHATRDGVYVDPALTTANAAKMHLDATFRATVTGNVYAQPLYVANGPSDAGAFFVATESNDVYALGETGAQVWTTNVGPSAPSAEKCGNIKPLGITGTPVIDLDRRAIYVDAARPGEAGVTMAEHEIHALSIDTGAELAGWPVLASSLASGATAFNPRPQNQRGALLVVGSTLYVPYGGHSGDCTDNAGAPYHGWVVGVPLDDPASATAWATESEQAGIWAVGGLASDGVNVFATTGNANEGQVCPNPPPTSPPSGWAQQEAMLRFQAGPVWSGLSTDYYAPVDWPCLDNADLDVGGSNPVLFDLPGDTPAHLAMASGKDGKMYLLDRTNLGGVGAELASMQVMTGPIRMAPAAYTTPNGTYVVAYASANGAGAGCPAGQAGNLVAVKVTPGSPPTLSTAWCANEGGQGSPIFTTSDGASDPLVWAIGAESSETLHAWNADTGAPVLVGTDSTPGFHHFSTIIVVKGRIFAGADGTLFAFTAQ